MNAFDAAATSGLEGELQAELVALFEEQNTSSDDVPLRVLPPSLA